LLQARLRERAQRLGRVPPGECLEGFVWRRALRAVRLQHALESTGHFHGGHIAQDFACELAPLAVATTEVQVVALDLAFAADDPRAEQADVADVVLRARIRAACEMDVERRLKLELRIEMVSDRDGMALGVGRRELAP